MAVIPVVAMMPVQVLLFDESERQFHAFADAFVRTLNIVLPMLLHGPRHDNQRTVTLYETSRSFFHSMTNSKCASRSQREGTDDVRRSVGTVSMP